MITPKFSCSQTSSAIIVSIYCPSVRAADVEINVQDTLVTIHINPYFLRLNFSGNLLEDEESSATYDPSSGYLKVTLTKETKGQTFNDLDLLAKLLAPRPSGAPPPSIEVLSREERKEDEPDLIQKTEKLSLEQEHEVFLKAAENDWQLPQEIVEAPIDTSLKKKYGFLNRHTGYFDHVAHSDNEANDLGIDAETCPVSQRQTRMHQREDAKWDEEHYLADYVDDEQIQELIHWQHPLTSSPSDEQVIFTDEEKYKMLNLPKREYIISKQEETSLYLTLISLLFSYTYEARMNQLDPSPESAWTICILTPAFTALSPLVATSDMWSTSELSSVVMASYRRSFAFPLYRSWALAECCRKDVAELLCRGKRTLTRCLLWMKDVLDHHEVYYVYSKIWLDDFCVWIQAHAEDHRLMELGNALRSLQMKKGDANWDLEELEAAVHESSDARDSDSDDE